MSRRLNAYLGTHLELRRLSGHIEQLQELQLYYEKVAPPSLAKASRVLQIENGMLTLGATNGAVAAKLRQLAPEMLNSFQVRFEKVTGIQIRVQVMVIKRQQIMQAATPLSAEGHSKMLGVLAEMRDSPVKEALQRLADKAAKRRKD